MIVVVDASAFVSATIKKDSAPERALIRAIETPNALLLSQPVLDEYLDVLFRPKLDRFMSDERRLQMLALVVAKARRVEPQRAISDCADPKDNKYLELAAEGHADAIVSGDLKHLLAMDPWRGIRLISPAAFLAMLGNSL